MKSKDWKHWTYKLLKWYIMRRSRIQLIKSWVIIWISIRKEKSFRFCFWENLKVFTSLVKNECSSKLKKVITFLSEWVEDLCTLWNSSTNTHLKRLKKLKEEMFFTNLRARNKFRILQPHRHSTKEKLLQSDHLSELQVQLGITDRQARSTEVQ